MKLYYSPGACSLSQHILLCLSGLDFTVERVDLRTKKTEHGKNFLDISPKGQVPTLLLDDGTILTENIAIAQYIADKAPAAKLLASIGDIERYQTLSWLSYVATDVHNAYGPLFKSEVQEEKDKAAKNLEGKYAYINNALTNRTFIATDYFTIADAYLYVVLRWRKVIPNLPSYPAIDRFMQKIDEMPAVKKALAEESK